MLKMGLFSELIKVCDVKLIFACHSRAKLGGNVSKRLKNSQRACMNLVISLLPYNGTKNEGKLDSHNSSCKRKG